MNVYAVIILATLVLDYALHLVADVLNLRALRPELPEAFREVYDAEAYRQSQAYIRTQTYFDWTASTCMLAVTLIFWFAGGFQALDVLVRGWGLGALWTGLCYIGLLLLGRALVALPFSIYTTFVIEARFGFNTTTPTTFIADRLKGLGLAILLGGPILAGILAFLTYAGSAAWLYCWLAATLFTLSVQYIAPTWIMPLFNTFTALKSGTLREAIMTYARQVRFPLQDISIMDGSRRSSKSNAFFTGFGTTKRIALFDTLVEQLSVPELVAVVAHEIGHYKKRHIVQGLLLSILHMGAVFFLLSIFLRHDGLFEAFHVEQPAAYSGLVLFGLLYAPVEFLLSIALGLVSRHHEYEADDFAVETTGTPEAMVRALQKLSVTNLSNLTPHPFYVFLNYSHPPVLERIRAIRRLTPRLENASS